MSGAPGWQPGSAWLFCPADRPERYAKALAVADVVILDLEDAVAPDRRAAAREALREAAGSGRLDPERVVVRVNAAGTADHAADRELVTTSLLPAGIRRVMLAKTETAAAVAGLDGCEVVALLETPRGIRDADAIAQAEGVVAVMWGADDLVAGLGGSTSRRAAGGYRDVARHARSRALIAAKAAGKLALDAVYLDIPDVDGLAAEVEDAVAIGFDGKVAIHPSQVPVIREGYRPTAEQVAWAESLLRAAEAAGFGVFTHEGRMVDGPVFAQAQRILSRARA
ncbi:MULTISPECIES: HpcH/HpaI aldolase/citrate lyase family protein [Amycolatopsis]|uniref:Citrate lyase subunit beta / citryl-CoA lyase n=2 Tax=Amycolatopsis TaxID=1813 RepID=A0A1I4C0I0_9PSEU|nr:CoA ester lyase [Amycolatopsis sacchari]SFK73917.1 citrate lyase subunit beta / citryl-CoA lyase [Amycolatopsis sacchari]